MTAPDASAASGDSGLPHETNRAAARRHQTTISDGQTLDLLLTLSSNRDRAGIPTLRGSGLAPGMSSSNLTSSSDLRLARGTGSVASSGALAMSTVATGPLGTMSHPVTAVAVRPLEPGKRTRYFRIVPAWSLLLAILILQVALSVRLLWTDTAFGDEALYLWAGHLEWAYWLHGDTSSAQAAFPTWFSGSPVIYPPLGAIADSIGGLAAARLLSMVFMLGTTSCLYGVTSRLLDRRAALFGALVFVILAPTQSLGAFATYDPMALFLLAFATWIGVQAASLRFSSRTVLLIASGAVLALADATKYAATLWDLAAFMFIAIAAWQFRGVRAGLYSVTATFGAWSLAIIGFLALGGHSYWDGIMQTTLARTSSNAPASAVLHQSFNDIGPVLVLALLGLLTSLGADNRIRVLCGSAMVAVLLAPVNQARIHTTTSLYKHVDFGAWFAAVAAGYLIARISRIDTRIGWRAAIAAGVSIPILLSALAVAVHLDDFWPNSSGMISTLKPLARPTGGPYLMEEFDVGYYYLHDEVYPGQISNMFGFLYWDQNSHTELSGARALTYAIRNRYFTIVEVDGQNIPAATTKSIEGALARTHGYKLIYQQPFAYNGSRHKIEIWRLTTPQGISP